MTISEIALCEIFILTRLSKNKVIGDVSRYNILKNVLNNMHYEMYMNVKCFSLVFGFYCNFQCHCALFLNTFSTLILFMKNLCHCI